MADFLPLAHRFAAALEQVPAGEAERDPAAAVHAITSAARRFGWTLTVTHWDLGVEAVARLAHKLAVTRGIRGTLGPKAGLAAMLTGPRTLSGLLEHGGGRLDALYGPLIRGYVEAGADRLLVVEASPPAGPPAGPAAAAAAPAEAGRTLRSIASTARYFRAPVMVLDLAGADPAAYPGFDHVFGRDGAVLLPAAAVCAAPDDNQVSLAGASVVTTAGQIPADCPPALVASWTEHIRGSGAVS
jgi:hypothetical protein